MKFRPLATPVLAVLIAAPGAVTEAHAASAPTPGPSLATTVQWRAGAQNAYRLANRAAYLRGDSRAALGWRARAAGYLNGWGSPVTADLVKQALATPTVSTTAPTSTTPTPVETSAPTTPAGTAASTTPTTSPGTPTASATIAPSGGPAGAAPVKASPFGLATPFDAFADGTLNGLETGYTITAADHLGQMVIEGASAGHIPLSEVARLRDWLLSVPRVETPLGTCVSYSDSPNDAVTARPDGTIDKCVNNVNASVGMFLTQAARLGVVTDGQQALAASIMRYTGSQALANGLWPYMTGGVKGQDLDHNALNVEAQYVTDGLTPLTARALTAQTSAALTADYTDDLGRLRTVAVDPGYCSTAFPSGKRLFTAVGNLGKTPTGLTTNITTIRYGQLSYYMARNYVLCGKSGAAASS